MIAGGVCSPDRKVQTEREPAQRLVVAHVKSRPHPAELWPIPSAIVRTIDQSFVVVPVDELVVKNADERNSGQRRDGGAEKNDAEARRSDLRRFT